LEKLVSWSQMKADETAWSVPVCQTIAIEGTGVDALISQVDAHHAYREAVTDSEARADLRRRRWTEEIVLSELQARARAALSQAVVDQSANPYELAQRVLREVLGSSD
jgi:putative protein kinase ArgK-like GTPase of G3E family